MMPSMETYLINHPILGPYLQVVCETIENAGHTPLPSGGRYGWGMPPDPATAEFIRGVEGKVILEIGSALGDIVVLPALENGARLVFATNIEREQKYFAEDSFLVTRAIASVRSDALRTLVLDEKWWDRDLQSNPTISSILAPPATAALPEDETVDLMIARHSAQFGNPDKFLRLLDLASAALRPGGSFTGINFTPYTGYMYQKEEGKRLLRMIAGNKAFSDGEAASPAGVIEDLMAFMGQPAGEEAIPFLYFDKSTIVGLLRRWAETRAARGLPQNLQLTANYYFSPPVIARVNKLSPTPELKKLETTENHEFLEQENHVFKLTKIA